MCAPQIYSSMAIILILMYQDGTICPAQVLSTASALRPLERDGGPNCALCSVHLVPLERMVSPTVLCALHLHWDLLREMVGPTVQRVWCLYCLWTRFHNWTRATTIEYRLALHWPRLEGQVLWYRASCTVE